MDRRVDDTRNSSLTHIIDNISSPVFNAVTSYVGAIGIYRHNGVWLLTSHNLQRSFQSCHLFLFTHLFGSRACRKCTNINHRSTFLNNLIGAFGNVMFGLFATAHIETIGCAVEDSHHFWRGEIYQFASNVEGIAYWFHIVQSYYISCYNPN